MAEIVSRYRIHNNYIAKTTDGYYQAVADREDIRRFAQSLMYLEEMAAQYPEAALLEKDVEQVGEPPGEPLPEDRLDAKSPSTEGEPPIDEWVAFDTEDPDEP